MLQYEVGPIKPAHGINCVEMDHQLPFQMDAHAHDDAHLAVVFSGIVECRYGSSVHMATPMTVAYTPPNCEHQSHYLTPVRAFYVAVEPKALKTFGAAEFIAPFEVARGPISKLAADIFSAYKTTDASDGCVREELVLEIFGRAAGFKSTAETLTAPAWLKQVKDFLHANPLACESVNNLASTVGVHPVHLMRTFKRFFGCSIGTYSRMLRVAEVCRRLKSDATVSVGEAAVEMGFPDQQYFANYFKKLTGLTPLNYLKAIRA